MPFFTAHAKSAEARRKAREGAAAVEFGLIALPFFVLLFSLFELGMVFFTDSVVENALLKTSRLVRTGEAKTQGFDQAKFKQAFCANMSVFKSDCPSRATVDVRVVANFSDNIDLPKNQDGSLNLSQAKYDGGDADQLIIARVWYKQPMIAPTLTQAATRAGNGQIMVTAAKAFRNEPWNG